MSQSIHPDDPRLTAYVLGELPDAERAEVETALAASPELRSALDELQDVSTRLFEALQAEPVPALTDAQRAAIHAAAQTAGQATAGARVRSEADGPAVVLLGLTTGQNRRPVSRRRAMVLAVAAAATVSAAGLLAFVGSFQANTPTGEIVHLTEQNDLLALTFSQDHDFDGPAQQIADVKSSSGVANIPASGPVDHFSLERDGRAAVQELAAKGAEVAATVVIGDSSSSMEGIAASTQAGVPVAASRPLVEGESVAQVVESARGEKMGFSRNVGDASTRTPTAGTPIGPAAEHSGPARVSGRHSTLTRGVASTESAPASGEQLSERGGSASPGYFYRSTSGKETAPQVPALTQSFSDENGNGVTPLYAQPQSQSPADAPVAGTTPLSIAVGQLSTSLGALGPAPLRSHTIRNSAVPVDPQSASATLDVPFRGGSFELGVPKGGEALITSNVATPKSEWFFDSLRRGRRLNEREELEQRTGRLRFGDGIGNESYAPIVENEFVTPQQQPLSTFGLDVDTASYANVRRFLKDESRWPPANAVRLEEMINFFSYSDPAPSGEHPLGVVLEVAACPWNPTHRLVRIGVKAREIDTANRPATSLVFLIDTSGSMRDENKLPLVKQSLRLLVSEMTENDRIALVTYSTNAGLLLDSTSGEHRQAIMSMIDSLEANGSTNGEAGLKLAYDIASRHFLKSGTNRVILCTDGDFNVGESADAPLVRLITEKRDTGVFLSICGFGTGNLKDAKLEQIADHGNGQYHYIDGIGQAKKVFLEELSGMLYTVAKDVKLQVEFNPAKVGAYRLLGYENRALAAEDFNNDRVDAGDVGAGHSVTALYEIVPPGAEIAKPASEAPGVDPLKYGPSAVSDQPSAAPVPDEFRRDAPSSEANPISNIEHPTSNELLTVKLRYKLPTSDESTKLEFPLVDKGDVASASDDLNWAAAVASFGMILRNSAYRGRSSIEGVLELARGAKGEDPSGQRREFIELVLEARRQYRQASGESSPRPPELGAVDSRKKATVDGRYHDLLDKLERPDDFDRYGDFSDSGWKNASADGKEPAGYWVYVYPHWYIWGETSLTKAEPTVRP